MKRHYGEFCAHASADAQSCELRNIPLVAYMDGHGRARFACEDCIHYRHKSAKPEGAESDG